MEKRLCTKLGIALIIVGSVFLLTVAAVLAASSSGLELSPLVGAKSGPSAAPLLDEEPPDDNDDGDGPELGIGGLRLADVITKTFGTDIISYTTVVSLRTGTYEVGGQPITRSFGWGQIFKLGWLAYSYSTTVSLDDLVISRTQEHMGWGKILHAVAGEHGFGRVAKGKEDVLPRNLGQAKKCLREGNCPDSEATAVTSSTSSPGQGNAYGHSKQGDQAHGNQGQGNQGNPHNGDHPGRGDERGGGQDKGQGKGKDK